MRSSLKFFSAIASVAVLTGCSQLEPDAVATPVNFVTCVLGDNFGLDDQTIGSQSYLGALQAQAQFGAKLRYQTVAPNAVYNDYHNALKNLMSNDCNVVIAIGNSAEAVEDDSALYANTTFIEVHGRAYSVGDASSKSAADLKNVRSISYRSEQGGFLAGYLAATQTQTQTVAAFGQTLNLAEVAILAGFAQGVTQANTDFNTTVQILGHAASDSDLWVSIPLGSTREASKQVKQFIAQSADVIFPVVGNTSDAGTGLTALTTANASDPKVAVIGSFGNWYASEAAQDVRASVIASVALTIQKDVASAIGELIDHGSFTDYVGTLDNGGVYLTGPNDLAFNGSFDSKLNSLKDQIRNAQILVRESLQ